MKLTIKKEIMQRIRNFCHTQTHKEKLILNYSPQHKFILRTKRIKVSESKYRVIFREFTDASV